MPKQTTYEPIRHPTRDHGDEPFQRAYVLRSVFLHPDNLWPQEDADPDNEFYVETNIEGVFTSPDGALDHINRCVQDEQQMTWLPSDEDDPRNYRTAIQVEEETGEHWYFACEGYVLDHCDWQAFVTKALQDQEEP
jgi:hypothetical protein